MSAPAITAHYFMLDGVMYGAEPVSLHGGAVRGKPRVVDEQGRVVMIRACGPAACYATCAYWQCPCGRPYGSNGVQTLRLDYGRGQVTAFGVSEGS